MIMDLYGVDQPVESMYVYIIIKYIIHKNNNDNEICIYNNIYTYIINH